MEFGISLDHSAVTQRHSLFDSDEEDELDKPDIVKLEFSAPILRKIHTQTLLFAFGQTACVFAKSYFNMSPMHTLNADTQAMFQGSYFPKDNAKPGVVSELFSPEGDMVVCLHEKNLKLEHVNIWCEKVCVLGHRYKDKPNGTKLASYHLTHTNYDININIISVSPQNLNEPGKLCKV